MFNRFTRSHTHRSGKRAACIVAAAAMFLFSLQAAATAVELPAEQTIPEHGTGGDITDLIIERIEIEIVVVDERDEDRWERIARNLIFLKEGEPFSDARFSQSVSALNRSRLFEAIEIPDPDWTDPPLTMVFRLKPFARIKDVKISGNFPLLEDEVTDVMTIYTGDAYRAGVLDDQAAYIRELYQAEGYIDPDVSIRAQRDPKDGHYVAYVDIDRGSYYEITRVRARGNEHFSGARVLFRLSTWQSSLLIGGAKRLINEKLKEDTETIRRLYWSSGFCEARVEADVRLDEERARARIDFHITEGPRYDVTITGNDAFSTRSLLRELTIYEEGNINDFGLRRSIRNLESRYREAGYLDVRIRRTDEIVERDGGPHRDITISIDEGARYIVDSVEIEGNRDLSTNRIKDQMLTTPPRFFHAGQYNPATLNEDAAAIRSVYRQRGYLSPIVEPSIETRRADEENILLVDVRINVREGPRTEISDIRIEGLDVFDEDDALRSLPVRPGDVYREHRIQDGRSRLAARISEQGYPHVRVETGTTMSRDETEAELVYRVDQGPYVEMGEMLFIGNFITRDKTLSRPARLSRNEPFSLSSMLEAQRNIRNINAIQNARFQTIGLEEEADRVTLLTTVNEKKPYFFQFATGYDTSRLFYFNTGVGTINLLGRNKELRAGGELSMIGYKGEIGYTEPNLFNTGIVADAAVYTEKIEELNKNFGVRSTGATIGFSRPLTPRISASLGFLYDHRDQYRTDDTPIDLEDEDQYRSRTVLVTTPGITYDSTDSFVRPTRGIRASASVGISRGLDNDLDNFFKYRLNTRYYYTPSRRLTFAIMGQVGYIDPYGEKDDIPDDQLFYLGGTMNVRGFSENRLRVDENRDPVGGLVSLMGTIEARYNIGRNFELATFYDTGSIREALRDEGSSEWRSSAGIGLRYHTPIGPIGLMHGWKLDRKEGESPGAYHFTIGYTF